MLGLNYPILYEITYIVNIVNNLYQHNFENVGFVNYDKINFEFKANNSFFQMHLYIKLFHSGPNLVDFVHF